MQRLTVQGRRRDIGLGSLSRVSPAAARLSADRNRRIAKAGGNPLGDHSLPAHQAAKKPMTLARWNAEVLKRRGGRQVKKALEAHQRVRLHAGPALGRQPLVEIEVHALAALLERIAEDSRPTARWLREEMARQFELAIEEGLMVANPARDVAVVDLPALQPIKALSETLGRAALARLPSFLAAIEADTRRPATFLLIRFCLLSARHPKEVRLAKLGQFDLEARLWRFRKGVKPGGEMIDVSMTDSLVDILRRVSGRAVGEDQAYVFTSHQGTNQPFASESISMSLKRAGYEDVVPLDFQRAHRVWVSEEGGDEGDLGAWEGRLRFPD